MEQRTICVTGASSYVGSWLVKKLLEKGHFVHGTLRNLGDETKVQFLQSFPGAEILLSLFEADIYESETFEPAIRGCEFVFLVATPYQNPANNPKYKDTSEASLAAIKTILHICEQSNTVKRVIYTGTVMSASPIKDDGITYKDFLDESCWTPLNITFPHCEDFEKAYTISKTLSEKEILSYNSKDDRKFEVVTLALALVGGDTLFPYLSSSQLCILSPIIGIEKVHYRPLKLLQAMLNSVPLVDIDDFSEACVFCMEQHSLSGRFLCIAAKPSIQEIINYFYNKGIKIKPEPDEEVVEEYNGKVYSKTLPTKYTEKDEPNFPSNVDKLSSLGFRYKKSFESILDDSLKCAKRLGVLNFASEFDV